jgi:hypothetical protein
MALEEWQKSSYSGASGTNDCVEVRWRKSRYSGGSGTNSCVEIAFVNDSVGVRDSKNASGSRLAFSPTAWRAFARTVK